MKIGNYLVFFLFYHKENMYECCNDIIVIIGDWFIVLTPIITEKNALSSANTVFHTPFPYRQWQQLIMLYVSLWTTSS